MSDLRLPRRSRVALSTLLALVLTGIGGTVAVDIIRVQTGHSAVIYPYGHLVAHLRRTQWNDPVVLGVAITAAAVGAVLLLAGLVPSRSRSVVLGQPSSDLIISARRSGLRRALQATAAEVDGTDRHRLKVTRRGVKVRFSTSLRDIDGIEEAGRTALSGRLADLEPARPLLLSVRVEATRD